MQLRVLVDNHTYVDQYYLGEPAVSYYIEDEGVKILFDVGYSDAFLRNAESMGIDLDDLDMLVISHGHKDHTGGLIDFFHDEVKDIELVAHPDAFRSVYDGDELISSPMNLEELEQFCTLKLSKEPVKLTEHLWFLGEIPQLVDFEARTANGTHKDGSLDYNQDDSALVYDGDDGLYIICGCAHSGICNICEYAKQVCGNMRIQGILGGFHLFAVDKRVKKTIDYLARSYVEELYPCHCTSFAVRSLIHQSIPVHEVGVNLELEWK
ncbi:MAG: MBL fold metallo-hydrolase [Erysipelotrichaceae bacterium]